MSLQRNQVKIQEANPSLKIFQTSSTAVSLFLGVTERGPIRTPTEIADLATYTKIFGGHRSNVTLRTAIEAHFNEGGGRCWVSRTCHYSDITDSTSVAAATSTVTAANSTSSATKGTTTCSIDGTYDLEPADTLVISTNGGGNETVTFDASAATRATAGAGPYVLADGLTLTYSVGGTAKPTITFATADFVDITAATALEVANGINKYAQGCRAYVNAGAGVTMETNQRGTGASIQITGGTANAAGKLEFQAGAATGSGDVANIDAVTPAEVRDRINADTTGLTATVVGDRVKLETDTAGATGSVQVQAASTADAIIGFDNALHSGANASLAVNTLKFDAKTPGGWGDGLTAIVSAASNASSYYFNLKVYQGGILKETWQDLSMSDTDDRYVEDLINDVTTGSNYIAVTDLDSANSAPADRPGSATYTLTGGNDGISALADTDYTGSQAGGTGLYAFDTVMDGTVLVVPDRSSLSAVSTGMINYAEDRRLFAIIDPPANLTASAAKSDLTSRGLKALSEYGAYYWPRVKVLNPDKTVHGTAETITIPPSGLISGLYGRVDGSKLGGVYLPPAGEEVGRLRSAQGLETTEVQKSAARGLVFPERINPITKNANGVYYVDGARTLKGTGNFPSVSERRGVLYIEKVVEDNLQTYRHRNNDARLWNEIAQSIRAFLYTQYTAGAFRGATPADSYTVNFGDDLNPPTEVFVNRINGEIGLATQKPAEFIIVTFQQDMRDIQAELAAAGA